VAEIEHGMSAREYEDWWRYHQEEPWGSPWENLLTGIVAAAVYNTRMGRRRGSADVQPRDFLLRTEPQKRAGETADVLAKLRVMARRRPAG
jgi:hypothetical protein